MTEEKNFLFREVRKKYMIILFALALITISAAIYLTIPFVSNPFVTQKSMCCAYPHEIQDYYNVERINEDTIRITQLTENPNWESVPDKPFVNKIYIDGVDVSDMSIIKKQNLEDIIYPSEGLVYGNGSKAVIKGSDISNKSRLILVRVDKWFLSDGNLTEGQFGLETKV
jgi:hypothetical protein